jgi:hypothetical protein
LAFGQSGDVAEHGGLSSAVMAWEGDLAC